MPFLSRHARVRKRGSEESANRDAERHRRSAASMRTLEASFTIIELVIVSGLTVVLALGVTATYQGTTRREALQRSANILIADIRRAQSLALSAEDFRNPQTSQQEVPLGGYGIFFPASGSTYTIFADWNGNERFDETLGESLETRSFASGVEFFGGSEMTAIFCPPYGVTLLYRQTDPLGTTPCSSAGGSPQPSLTMNVTATPKNPPDLSLSVRLYATGAVDLQ